MKSMSLPTAAAMLVAILIRPVWADPPMSNLYGADITIKGKKRSGYIGVFAPNPVDVSKSDLLPQIRKYKQIGFVENLINVKFLIDMRFPQFESSGRLVSTSGPMEFLDSTSLDEVSRATRPYDGHQYYADIIFIPEKRARLLHDKRPVYSCSTQYSENPTLYWVSYSKTVGQEVLEPICNAIEPPEEKLEKTLLKNPRVFQVRFSSD